MIRIKKKSIGWVALCAVLLLTGCGAATDLPEKSGVQTSEETDEETGIKTEPYLLSFETTTVDGVQMTSDCFAQSRLTMINVWGTYCNPCLMEMPDLGEIAASYDVAEFQMLGVVSDVAEGAKEADLENAALLIEETKADYPHLLVSDSLYQNLVGGIEAVPTTFFVNQKGELLGYVVGAQPKENWVNLIEELLAKME